MIIKFKIFEQLTPLQKTKSEIEYWFIMTFKNEKEFIYWCMKKDDVKFPDDVVYGNIIEYDIPVELGLPTSDGRYTEIIDQVISEIDLNDPKYDIVRSGVITYDEWKNTLKYNL